VRATLTFWHKLTDPVGDRRQIDWSTLFTRLEGYPGSFKEDDHPGWSAATFRDDKRSKSSVDQVFALMLDYDGTTAIDTAADDLGRWYGMIHTTKRHSDDVHRFRAMLPLARPVSWFEFDAIWRRISAKWPGKIDPAAKDASRFWYWPGCVNGAPYDVRHLKGQAMDPDEVLSWPEPRPQPQQAPTTTARQGYAGKALQNEVESVLGAGQGARNDTLNRAAFSLGQLVAGGSLQRADVEQELQAAAISIGLKPGEVGRTIASGIKRGMSDPRQAPIRSPPAALGSYDPAPMREPGDDSDEEEAQPEGEPWERFGAESMSQMLASVYLRSKTKEKISRISTCHPALDNQMRGFRRGRVTVLGAATNWGKSSWAIMIADEACLAGKKVLIITAEDPVDMFATRFAARRTGINAMRMLDNDVSNEELIRLGAAADSAPNHPALLSAISKPIEWVAAAVRAFGARGDYDLVVLDYLQAMTCLKKAQDRRNEVTYIARCFCDAVKDSDISGLLISQFKRLDSVRKPTMHDLKESGDIENMAEHIVLGWSENDVDESTRLPRQTHYVQLAKNKDGPKGKDPLFIAFDTSTASFKVSHERH